MLVGILICDSIHIYGTATALGLDVFLNPSLWRVEDWVNIVILLAMLPVRLGVIFEVGFTKSAKAKTG